VADLVLFLWFLELLGLGLQVQFASQLARVGVVLAARPCFLLGKVRKVAVEPWGSVLG
jgi:hypothetical protein